MRFVLSTFCALALATPAMAQTSNFAHLSVLDSAVFGVHHTPERYAAEPAYDYYSSVGPMKFSSISESYTSSNIMENVREVRRYGGRVSVHIPWTSLLLEGEGARDYGPSIKKLDIGRLRFTKRFGDSYSAGVEIGLFNMNPKDHSLPHHHIDREVVYGFHFTKTMN